ncbi:hypothetical protein G9A89_007464 [Geosiphon pyriformis]|nr:hypothetical protein G9A89_007464 [Geosiphon pyriformis]
MGNYLYLPQQSKEHFEAHNKNDLDFIELNPLPSCLICFSIEEQSSKQFQDFWNWFLNEHSAETYTAYTTYYFDQAPDFEYLNHQIHTWIAAHQLIETFFETAPVFDLFLSELDHSTQTVTPEPMANDPMQQNILIALQGIQTALGRKNNTPLPLFRAATVNQYDNEYKFQIIGGYLQGSSATWFLQETNVNTQQRIIRWTPANAGKDNTSFTTQRTQGSGKIVTEYAKAIRKLIMQVDSGRNWTEEQKIHSFTKELRTDLSYALWSLLALKNNPTMDAPKIHTSSFCSCSCYNSYRLTANLSKQLERIYNPKDPDLNPILINPSNPLIKDNKIMAHLCVITILLVKVHFIIITDFKVSNNNTNSKVTTVMNRSTSKDTTKNIDQVEGNSTINTENEENSTFIPNQMPVKKTRPTASPFRFEHNSVIIRSVNTSNGDNTPFRIANTTKRTAPHQRAADFSPITGNRLEKKPNKKYRYLEKISVKGLTKKFNQVFEEKLTDKTADQTNNFGASKSLKKLDKPFKLLIEDVERAAQIEAALRKCNPKILDMINKGKSVEKTDEQMDNLFETNKDIANLEDTAEDMKDSKSSLSSRMPSSSLGQKSNKLSERNAMSTEANQEEGWKTVIYGTKRHVLFVQILDIPEKNMGKKVGWIYNLLGDVSYLLGAVMVRNQEIRIDFFKIAGRDQAKKILADVDIESFLMTTDDIANQMASQKKVLVRDILLGISDREVGAAIKEFGKLAVIESNNQEEVTRAVNQWLTLIRKDAIKIYPIIGIQKIIEQKKTWEAKLPNLALFQELAEITPEWAVLT